MLRNDVFSTWKMLPGHLSVVLVFGGLESSWSGWWWSATRPGAKRVRLWRDRPLEGAFPLLEQGGFCPLCRKAPKSQNLLFTDHRKVLNTIYGTNCLLLFFSPKRILWKTLWSMPDWSLMEPVEHPNLLFIQKCLHRKNMEAELAKWSIIGLSKLKDHFPLCSIDNGYQQEISLILGCFCLPSLPVIIMHQLSCCRCCSMFTLASGKWPEALRAQLFMQICVDGRDLLT